jgi:hypothetical protein
LYLDLNQEFVSCVLALLSLPSSEASVERTFSTQALTHTKLRNRTSNLQINNELMIKLNRNIENESEERKAERVHLKEIDGLSLCEDEGHIVDLFNRREIHVEKSSLNVDDAKDEQSDHNDSVLPIISPQLPIISTSNAVESARPPKKQRVKPSSNYELPLEDFQKTQAFVQDYVNDVNNNLKHGMKWNRQQLSNLQQAAIMHDIRDTEIVLVNKIKAILKEKSNDIPMDTSNADSSQ